MDNIELFERLNRYFSKMPDRRGEVYINCPACGHESSRQKVHCSYSKRGFHCFVCGKNLTLYALAEIYNLLDNKKSAQPYVPPIRTPQPEKPKADPSWTKTSWDFVRGYESGAVDRWRSYKPLKETTVQYYHLGYGKFPTYSSKCQHDRLIVPLICGGTVVGFRGRNTGCDCAKWLSVVGSKPVLYNGGQFTSDPEARLRWLLGDAPSDFTSNKVVIIVENPIDALMIDEQFGAVATAVATLGVTIWHDEWTTALQQANPVGIVVCYDHDLAGNGGSNEADHARMVKDWRTKNPQARYTPIPNGVRLVNNLIKARLPARLYHWPVGTPDKFDIGGLLTKL